MRVEHRRGTGPGAFGRRLRGWLCALIVALVPGAAGANPAYTDHAIASLVSEVDAIAPGEPFWVALDLDLTPGWHTYWSNPGDSGLATEIRWDLPEGFGAGEIQWPRPERVPIGPLMNYGYHDGVTLLVQITPPPDLSPGSSATLRAQAHWLVCLEDCIPEDAELELSLPVAQAPAPGTWEGLFAATRARLPRPAPWPVAMAAGAERIELRLPPEAVREGESAYFYAAEYGLVEHAAPQPLVRGGDELRLTLTRGDMRESIPEALPGVLVVEGGGAPVAYAVTAEPAGAAGAAAAAGAGTLLQALLLAVAGGMLLNLMPCVFPVLSMKVVGLVGQGGKHHAHVRLHGLAYTAGVLVFFIGLAALMLGLRSAGTEVGWGFQLQSPVLVSVLACLMFFLGLVMSGAASLGWVALGAGQRAAAREGSGGAFATGALAAVVATPCTVPFMGAAMAYAVVQPWQVALLVFAALGLGLALPYLLFCFSPALVRRLPRPGPWMERLKELLAFPLYATAAWLVWVLSQQAGSAGVAAVLAGMVFIAFAVWLGRVVPSRRATLKTAGIAAALAAAGVAVASVAVAPQGLGLAPAAGKAQSGLAWQAYSGERLAALRAEGRPVFLNVTAAWCITCLANEVVVLDSEDVVARFEREGVVALKGDWTNRDPELTSVLGAFGRTGVPLYVFYGRGGREPIVLPQVLTRGMVEEALASL